MYYILDCVANSALTKQAILSELCYDHIICKISQSQEHNGGMMVAGSMFAGLQVSFL